MSSSITLGQRDQIGNFASAAARKAVDELGLDGDAVQLVITRGDKFSAAVKEAVRQLSLGTADHDRARAIMGRNMFGFEEMTEHFHMKSTPQLVAALAVIPFSEATLRACKDTHVLVAFRGTPLMGVRNEANDLFYDQDWYESETFAKEVDDPRWCLVRKTPVEKSTSKTWDEQQALLGKHDETPLARVMVYTIIGHFKATGERLFENVYVRCSDVDSGGDRVSVGYFDSGGLNVVYDCDDGRDGNIGLASARKFD